MKTTRRPFRVGLSRVHLPNSGTSRPLCTDARGGGGEKGAGGGGRGFGEGKDTRVRKVGLFENKNDFTWEQLRIIGVYSAVPMVGFGFMDNFIMIQAGDLIDSTIGVTFGLATLTSAAFGQVISDVVGVTSSGAVEALVVRLGLPVPDLSLEQRQTPFIKFVVTCSAALGIVVGCLLGMTCLLFKDLKAIEREKRRKELNTIFNTVVTHGKEVVKCDRCSLFIVDHEGGELWTSLATGVGKGKIIQVPLAGTSIAADTARTAKSSNVKDVYQDPRFDKAHDASLGYKTQSILSVPVLGQDGRVSAVVQMVNKHNEEETAVIPFTSIDESLVKMMTVHIGIFLKSLDD